MIGETIAQYKIVEKLGEGGMGVVYKAQDTRLERDVALKFLRTEHVRGEEDTKRFFREAKVLAAIDHPNICTVYDVNEADGRAYIAMAFLKGEDLHEVVKRGALPVEEALDITRQVATGLQAAHDSSVIHRDIKSTNIILTPQGTAKILDFGLARLSDRTTLTAEGMTMGTIAYMSPEQATGAGVDHRTDIWAAGVLLYELLTGALPFHADFDQAVVYLILNQEPKPLAEYRDDVPDAVQAIVDRALAKDAAKRFQSAAELSEAIDAVKAGEGQAPSKAPAAAPSVKIDPNQVAVFDFANGTGSAQDDWLSGGIAETLTADLRRVKSLRVVARQPLVQASAALKQVGSDEAVSLGRTFGAGWAVWGEYQRLGEVIKITANFTRVTTGEAAGTCTASGPMSDIFKLQQEIVAKLADTIEVKLTTSELEKIEHKETSDEQAYEYYARARYRTNRMGTQDFDETRALYEKAIELDPDYAFAYAGLANLYLFRHIARADPADLEKGKQLAEKVVQIDPELPDGYLWLGYAYFRSHQWAPGLEAGRRAIALEDNNPMSHYFHGTAVLGTGGGYTEGMKPYSEDDRREGRHHLRRATELSPRLQTAFMTLGWHSMLNGRYDEAMPDLERAVALERTQTTRGFAFVGAQTLMGDLHLRRGELESAKLSYENSAKILEESQHVYRNPFLAYTHCGLGDLRYRQGDYVEAVKHYGRAVELGENNPNQSAMGFFFIRGRCGMAKSYGAMAVSAMGRENLDKARKVYDERKDFSFLWMWGACDAQAWFDLASAYAEFHDNDEAIACLEKAAVHFKWADLPTLQADENLGLLLDDRRMQRIVEEIQKTTSQH